MVTKDQMHSGGAYDTQNIISLLGGSGGKVMFFITCKCFFLCTSKLYYYSMRSTARYNMKFTVRERRK